jgi:hypothetical protein
VTAHANGTKQVSKSMQFQRKWYRKIMTAHLRNCEGPLFHYCASIIHNPIKFIISSDDTHATLLDDVLMLTKAEDTLRRSVLLIQQMEKAEL